METPAELLDLMDKVLEEIQTNDAHVRKRAADEGLAASARLAELAHLGPSANIICYCGEYDLHVERLATATRDPDGNHIDLLGAMTATDKLRGWAGFKLK